MCPSELPPSVVDPTREPTFRAAMESRLHRSSVAVPGTDSERTALLDTLARARASTIARLEARGAYPNWVLLAALAGMFATTFPVTILTLSLGTIAREFQTSETSIAWVISAPMLLSAVALPLLGKLGDLRGHRRVFLVGFSGATVVAAATATAWDAGSLIAFRTLAAILGGATQPTAMALIFSVYPPERRVRAMGWWSMTGAAAPALGLVAGGPLVDLLGWRVVFVFQALLSACALTLACVILRETPTQNVRFDVRGALCLALAVLGSMALLAGVRDLALSSGALVACGLVAFAGLSAFIAVERRTAEPLLPLEFFARRGFTAPILSNAFMSAAYMGAFVIAPFVLLEQFGFSISVAAGIMLMRTVSLSASSPLGGSLGQRIGQRNSALLGSFVLMLGLVLMSWAVGQGLLLPVCIALVLQGVGHGLCLPSLTASISNAVPQEDLGIASAANRLTAQLGSALGITALTLVYASIGATSGLVRAFWVAAVLAGLSCLSAGFMERADAHSEASASGAPR